MTMEAPVCLVCGKPLKLAGGNTYMYFCDKRQEYVSDWGVHVDVTDTVISVEPDGRESMWIVEIPPYKFTMTDWPEGPKTEIHKKYLPDWPPWNKTTDPESLKSLMYSEVILTLPVILKLPWHDRQKVLERLKLYLLFS